MHDNGFGTRKEPILGPMTYIKEMDALMARDESGEPKEPDWPEADVIAGNPPFLGGKRLRAKLEDGYVDDLFGLYRDRMPREADLVTYWFERARADSGRKDEACRALGDELHSGWANRRVLQRIRESGGIFFAVADQPWILNDVAARVLMVGFDDGSQKEKILDGTPAEDIYSDLTGALDLTKARHPWRTWASPSWATRRVDRSIYSPTWRERYLQPPAIRTAGRAPTWCAPGPTD